MPGGKTLATNQVLYNAGRRGIGFDLLPWCRSRGVPVTAYSPIEPGRLLAHPEIGRIATAHGATPTQVALAWVPRHDAVIAIPKAGRPEHVRENRGAVTVVPTAADLAAIDRAFPPPRRATPLQML